MSYSKLVSFVKLSPNCSVRSGAVEGITVHHAAANATVEALGNVFARPARQASANYGIGSDGRIACYAEEEKRAWTSGNRENDNRCITIEVANCSGAPDWKISDKAYESLIALCVDICQRHGFTLNYTGDTSGNLTMHKWFQATACPGPYLEVKFPAIANEVNARLNGADTPAEPTETPNVFYRVQVGAFKVKANAENQRAKLQELGYDGAFVVSDGEIHRVQVGAFGNKDNADALCRKLKEQSMEAFVVTVGGEAQAQAKTVEELAREVIRGKHGSGAARKQSLGDMYEAVQARVDELMK